MKTHTQPDWNSLVAEFGRLIGADGLEIDSAGACRLDLGDGLGIDFEKDLQVGLHLYCTMPPVPELDRPAAALRLMAENYSAQRHHSQAAFAYDEGSGEFLLHLHLPDSIHGLEEFESAVRHFTEHAEHWTKVIHSGLSESPSPATSAVQIPHFA
jgi:hypothetical protein